MIKDPTVLLSVINTKLRDFYDSIESLCDDLDYSQEEIDGILNKEGYFYDRSLNQYRLK